MKPKHSLIRSHAKSRRPCCFEMENLWQNNWASSPNASRVNAVGVCSLLAAAPCVGSFMAYWLHDCGRTWCGDAGIVDILFVGGADRSATDLRACGAMALS